MPAKGLRCKLDKPAFATHVHDYPDALLNERAAHFRGCINAIWMVLKKLKITKKRPNAQTVVTRKDFHTVSVWHLIGRQGRPSPMSITWERVRKLYRCPLLNGMSIIMPRRLLPPRSSKNHRARRAIFDNQCAS
jgi:transposase